MISRQLLIFFAFLEVFGSWPKAFVWSVGCQQHGLFVRYALWYTQEPLEFILLLFDWEYSTALWVVKSVVDKYWLTENGQKKVPTLNFPAACIGTELWLVTWIDFCRFGSMGKCDRLTNNVTDSWKTGDVYYFVVSIKIKLSKVQMKTLNLRKGQRTKQSSKVLKFRQLFFFLWAFKATQTCEPD